MPVFDYTFDVDAPVEIVSAFHHDTSVLKTLTPPPIFAQIHEFEPMGEGSLADFTLWFGPFPVHWIARHSDVSVNGFTDTQVEGPLKAWRHTHRFSEIAPGRTRVHEHIEYEYADGFKGILNRLMFGRPGLVGLFTARKLITRRNVAKMMDAQEQPA
jgi:ligand-binding SRPBCC domain-containing protein